MCHACADHFQTADLFVTASKCSLTVATKMREVMGQKQASVRLAITIQAEWLTMTDLKLSACLPVLF